MKTDGTENDNVEEMGDFPWQPPTAKVTRGGPDPRDTRIKELENALTPFARFACSKKNSCLCNNCIARDLLNT